MRIAALYDVHGNLPALEAVLADPRFARAEAVVSGGDLVAGPMPADCLDLLASLDRSVAWVRGNGDREVVELSEAHGASWCADRLGAGRLETVAAWPLIVPAGGIAACHATPRADDEIVTSLTSDEEMQEAFASSPRYLTVVGHTHVQFDRVLPSGKRVVNAGSVGRPYEGRRGAFWALLDGDHVELLQTEYDVEAAAAAIAASGYPDAAAHAAQLLDPPTPAEVVPLFEGRRA